ncbi:MAG: hypothetical protein WBB37_06845 [bacterium]
MLIYMVAIVVILFIIWLFMRNWPRLKKDRGPTFSNLRCPTCKVPFRYENKRIKILLRTGNEEILNLCSCDKCHQYFIDGYEDVFASEDECKEWIYGPYTEEDVAKFSEVLKKCPDPLDKHCKCAAHEYFYNRIYPSL